MHINQPFKPGQPLKEALDAGRFEEIRRALVKSDFSVSPPLEKISGPFGDHLRLNMPEPFMVQLSGSSSPYAWQEIHRVVGGWVAEGRSGTQAYEVNGTAGLNGTRQLLHPGYGGKDWRFQTNKVGTGGTPCPGPITIGMTYSACGGTKDLHTLSVLVTKPDGTTVSPTINYVRSGSDPFYRYSAGWSITGMTQVGTYTATVSGSGVVSNTTTLTVNDLCSTVSKSVNLTANTFRVHVVGCDYVIPTTGRRGGAVGANVVISGGGISGGGLTDEEGNITIPITSEWDGVGQVSIAATKCGWKPASTTRFPFTATCLADLVLIPCDCYSCAGGEMTGFHGRPEVSHGKGTLSTPFGSVDIGCDGSGQKTVNVLGWGYCTAIGNEGGLPGQTLYYPAWNCPGDNVPTMVPVTITVQVTGDHYALSAAASFGHFSSDLPPGKHYTGELVGAVGPTVTPLVMLEDPPGFVSQGDYAGPPGSPYAIFDGTYTFASDGDLGCGCGGGYSGMSMASLSAPAPSYGTPQLTDDSLIIRMVNNTFTGYGQHATHYAKELEKLCR